MLEVLRVERLPQLIDHLDDDDDSSECDETSIRSSYLGTDEIARIRREQPQHEDAVRLEITEDELSVPSFDVLRRLGIEVRVATHELQTALDVVVLLVGKEARDPDDDVEYRLENARMREGGRVD